MRSYYRPDYEPHQEPYRRARRRRRALRVALVAGLAVAGVAGAGVLVAGGRALGAGWLEARVAGLGLFRIGSVQVSGNRTLTTGAVLEAGGLRPGASLLTLDLAFARERLRSHPWIREASLRRSLPSTLEVVVEERVPLVVVRADRDYLVDAEGAVVASREPQPRPGLPLLLGVETGAGRLTARGQEDLQAGLALVAAIRAVGFPALEAISHFDLSDPDDVVIVPVAGRPLVHAGREDAAQRLRRWRLIAPDMAQRWPEMEYVDLRAAGQIVAKPFVPPPEEKRPAPAAGAAPAGKREPERRKTGGKHG